MAMRFLVKSSFMCKKIGSVVENVGGLHWKWQNMNSASVMRYDSQREKRKEIINIIQEWKQSHTKT